MRIKSPPPGTIFWWKTQMGELKNEPASPSNLVSALADASPTVRRSACAYLEAISFQLTDKALLSQASPYSKALWVAFAATSIRARLPGGISPDGLPVLRKAYSEDVFSQGDPRLAVLTAFELARLDNDTRGLDIVTKRQFPKGTLADIRPELSRIVYDSDLVRKKMIEASPKWDDFSADDVKAIAALPGK
ncbi:MAG: hypothetical protein ABSD58_00275 [Verrucomicrobiia bacterium]|jgi:hypothetical protein